VAGVWLLSRSALALTAIAAAANGGFTIRNAVGRWDVQHYITIANQGYENSNDMAFFPGLPLLLRALNTIGIPMEYAGVLLSLLASGFAAAALGRMYGPLAAVLWLIAPTAVFTTVGYTEALFCACAFWAWERASAGQWSAAGVLAAFAGMFRISGLFLWGALGLLALQQSWRGGLWQRRSGELRHFASKVVWLLLPLLVLGCYALYLHHLTGSWAAWWEAQQSGWGRTIQNPWDTLMRTIAATHPESWPGRPEIPWIFRAEIASVALGLGVVIVLALRQRFSECGWIAVQLLAFGTSVWYISVNRAVLLWFPLFGLAAAAAQWAPARPGLRIAWRVLSALGALASFGVLLVWGWLFYTAHWCS
jgi:hypothetical protein